MYKIDICTFQIGKAQLGAKTRSPEDNIPTQEEYYLSFYTEHQCGKKPWIKLATNQSM
jgi:hypothetical protein